MNPITYMTDTLMIPFLSYIYHNIIPNYGVAIILLTLLIKMAFYPLTRKQFESMKAQKKVQPIMKELQAKYKEDPQKLQKEMMKMWKEHGANPFSGCLPMVVQIPVFIAVFYTIKSQAFMDLIAQPGVNPGMLPFWITNLGLPDKTYILPILVGLTTYLSQKMMTVDPKQAQLMMFMPILMIVICLKMPSGVLVYWAASQGISLAQQYYVLKKEKTSNAAEK